MMRFSQPIPNLSASDVHRVLTREFVADFHREAATILAKYGAESWHPSPARTQMAILKVANGQLEHLQSLVDSACNDPRDVIAFAEYPRYLDASRSRTPSWWEQARIFSEDWKAYKAWLNKT